MMMKNKLIYFQNKNQLVKKENNNYKKMIYKIKLINKKKESPQIKMQIYCYKVIQKKYNLINKLKLKQKKLNSK